MCALKPNAYLVVYESLNGKLYPDATDSHSCIIDKLRKMPMGDGIFVRSIDPIYVKHFPELPRPCHQKVKFRILRRRAHKRHQVIKERVASGTTALKDTRQGGTLF